MKSSLLSGLRASIFAIAAFAIVALTQDVKVKSSLDVAGFVIMAGLFWFFLERVILMAKKNKKPPHKPGAPR